MLLLSIVKKFTDNAVAHVPVIEVTALKYKAFEKFAENVAYSQYGLQSWLLLT